MDFDYVAYASDNLICYESNLVLYILDLLGYESNLILFVSLFCHKLKKKTSFYPGYGQLHPIPGMRIPGPDPLEFYENSTK